MPGDASVFRISELMYTIRCVQCVCKSLTPPPSRPAHRLTTATTLEGTPMSVDPQPSVQPEVTLLPLRPAELAAANEPGLSWLWRGPAGVPRPSPGGFRRIHGRLGRPLPPARHRAERAVPVSSLPGRASYRRAVVPPDRRPGGTPAPRGVRPHRPRYTGDAAPRLRGNLRPEAAGLSVAAPGFGEPWSGRRGRGSRGTGRVAVPSSRQGEAGRRPGRARHDRAAGHRRHRHGDELLPAGPQPRPASPHLRLFALRRDATAPDCRAERRRRRLPGGHRRRRHAAGQDLG